MEFVQPVTLPVVDQPRLQGQAAPGASRAPAVVAADTDVVPGNHCWQYERRSAAVSITSTPDVPSGLVSHAESVIDQWIATLPCQDAIAPTQFGVEAQID